MVLYSRESLSIVKNENEDFILCYWRGSQNKITIKEGCKEIISIVSQFKMTKVLNDNTLVENPWHQFTDWTLNNWFPKIFSKGVTRFAWILPKKIFPGLSAKRAMPDSKFTRSFASEKEAIPWLNTDAESPAT